MSEESGDAVLAFRGVSSPGARGEPLLEAVTLSLAPAELLMVTVESEEQAGRLADLAGGLVAPAGGAVVFQGRDWRTLAIRRACRERGRIGRVFAETGWISHLDVTENVTLAQRHHTGRSESELLAEANRLAQLTGLADVPSQRPDTTDDADLRRYQWVRAFLGDPVLLLLERPDAGLAPGVVGGLAVLVAAALARRAAVLWLRLAKDQRPELDVCRVRYGTMQQGRLLADGENA